MLETEGAEGILAPLGHSRGLGLRGCGRPGDAPSCVCSAHLRSINSEKP